MENFDFDTFVQVLLGAINLICQLIQIEKRLKRKKLKRRHRK